ncbi:MAG: PQQ-binding-like beta-propeller repeat protein [Verrucomicrobia bacterium]|nr:PQQ-binding-like beta-propeller repeat protein [Verrucomicrobiota bacterium]
MRSLVLVLVASSLTATAGQWPGWRGPDGNGTYQGKKLPLHWSTNENVRWRRPLPERGNSTPIVWNDRVFITQAVEKENRRTVMCFDRRDGKLLWQVGPTLLEKEPTVSDNPPCTPSPVSDDKRVIAWFGSAGVYCYDFDGRELWHRDLGPQSHIWGYASSPALYRELCFLNFGPGERSFVIALNKRTGKTVWQRDPPAISADAKSEDYGGEASYKDKPGAMKISEVAGSWATPLVVRAGNHDELVVAFALRLMALAPKTGELLWTCDGPNIGIYSSPFSGEGIVGLNGCGLRNTVIAVRPGGRGNVTATRRLWIQYPGNSKGSIGAGLISQGHIYQVNWMGFAECRELKTGEIVWEERLTGTGARNASWSSPVLADGWFYAANLNADVFVLRASPKFECVATNSIGSEPMNASLAVSDGEIFIRTDKHLWCIGATKKR